MYTHIVLHVRVGFSNGIRHEVMHSKNIIKVYCDTECLDQGLAGSCNDAKAVVLSYLKTVLIKEVHVSLNLSLVSTCT